MPLKQLGGDFPSDLPVFLEEIPEISSSLIVSSFDGLMSYFEVSLFALVDELNALLYKIDVLP